MTSTTIHPQRITALAVLFGDNSPEAALQRLWDGEAGLDVPAALDRVEPVLQAAAKLEISNATSGLLQKDLISLLIDGWRKHEDLVAAARRTLHAPGTTELVDLATHRVTATEHPYVDVLVDGVNLGTIHLELSVVFDVSVLVASVRSGKLVALRSGRTDITATLAIDGVTVATRHKLVDLPLSVALGDGIPLLPS